MMHGQKNIKSIVLSSYVYIVKVFILKRTCQSYIDNQEKGFTKKYSSRPKGKFDYSQNAQR